MELLKMVMSTFFTYLSVRLSLLFINKKVCIIAINWMLMLELILQYSCAYYQSTTELLYILILTCTQSYVVWCGVILNRAGHHSMENELSRIPGIRTQDLWAMVLRSGKWNSSGFENLQCEPQTLWNVLPKESLWVTVWLVWKNGSYLLLLQ